MLEVIFYQSTDDLTESGCAGNSLIICPSPIVADGLRRLMPKNSEIITISKWVTDYLKSKNLKRSNKSELMLRLSSVWRHYYPDEEAHLFFKSFELFTDLRSFTLNLEMLSEFLKEVDEITTKSILIFWTFLQNEKLIDEHLSYQILSEMDESDKDKPVWIMGFKHLSGIQIDMLKVIGEKRDVSVFFPKDIYPETLGSDWIRWLVNDELAENEAPEKTLKIIHFPKNKLNIVLNSLKKTVPHFDIALASQNVSLNFRQEVLSQDLFFKSQEDLFSVQREALMEVLREEVSKTPLELEAFVLMLEEKKKAALLDENFILYKVILLLNDALRTYSEFQSAVDLFALKVLKMILELNTPRVSVAALSMNPINRLLELNELPYRDCKQPLVLVASSSYGPLKSAESKYSEKMIEALRTIAPVKRSGLDFLYLKNELSQTLSQTGNILLMEEGLELIDLSWREILKGFDGEAINPETHYQLKSKSDYLAKRMVPGPYIAKNISASRLQLFMDCPRKYYFSYIAKIDHRPEDRLKIAPDEMGTIEHEIIEKYFENKIINQNLCFDRIFHESLCMEALDSFIANNKIILKEKNKLTTYYELLHYTQNGIEYLIGFCRQYQAEAIEFEKSLGDNPWKLIGSIDCLIRLPDRKIAVFDFKRSGAAIGSKRDTLAFDKIQIWVYLLIINRHQANPIHSWGYLNLSEIDSSQIYNEEEALHLSESVIDSFQALLEQTIAALESEIRFTPKPRNSKVCNFCEMEMFCAKESCE